MPEEDAPAIDPRVAKFIDAARKNLVETGTRNRLIHVNRRGRGKFLNIINERADDVFRILYTEQRRMRFHAAEDAAKETGEEQDNGVHLGDVDLGTFQGVEPIDESRFTDRLLDTALGTDALQKKLLRMARDARTAEEEQGINILFLAVGFLEWYEDESSQVLREAPLVLIPVELVRNERTSTYDVQAREEDIQTNQPLQARLRGDFGLRLPEIDMDSRADNEWSPSAYFAAVRDILQSKPRWKVQENAMQLGFFSFAKQLMQHDLQPDSWPEGELGGNPAIRALTVDSFRQEPPLFPAGERLDKLLPPEKIVQVIDADAPQTRVIEEVRQGRNLVVQGPPGTGKSQTITNIIAAAAHDGKTVLFMAEKMAALEVVHNRIRKCGLGHLCLKLHSRHANRRKVVEEIGRTLQAGRQEAVQGIPVLELQRKQDALNRISDLLHSPVADRDYTPFKALAELIGCLSEDRPPPALTRDGLDKLTRAQCQQIENDLDELARLPGTGEARRKHPFFACRNIDLGPVEQKRLKALLASAEKTLAAALASCTAFTHALPPGDAGKATTPQSEEQFPKPKSLAAMRRSAEFLDLLAGRPRDASAYVQTVFGKDAGKLLGEALGVGAAWAKARKDAGPQFHEHAWETPAAALTADLEGGAGAGWKPFFVRLGRAYRRASRMLDGLTTAPLPRAGAERVALASRLAQVQRLRRELAQEEGFLAHHLGASWRGERTDFATLQGTMQWIVAIEATGMVRSASALEQAIETIRKPAKPADDIREKARAAEDAAQKVVDCVRLDLAAAGLGEGLHEAPLDALRHRCHGMTGQMDRYEEWRRIETLTGRLRAAGPPGLGELVDQLDEGRLAPEDARPEFRYACAETRWHLARRGAPALDELADQDRHKLVSAFAELDRRHAEDMRDLIRSRHLARLPQGGAGEMGIIRAEIGRKRRHRPIRKLMEKAGAMIQRIKPVFLMSPISIAQFLPPGVLRFDLLVVDEASQVRPEDAIGAIARCRQLVIVGDSKQLPPTSFFDRLGSDQESEEDEEDEEENGLTAVGDMESVLTLCEARGMSQRMLEWHYRSRDPSLIQVSNQKFYDERLILPPSPLELDPDYGLSLQRVPGVYARRGRGTGRPGTNRIEAEHLAQAVAEHARGEPHQSLGIVTFSKAQADMVTEILEYERRQNAVLNDFLRENHPEDVFVKNIENVQGDERDVIFISVGYGPTEPGGRLSSMRFGPINAEGGERRLNVLFTRARARCRVFASFDPADMDLSRSTRPGPGILKRFLEYAQTGQAVEHRPTGKGPDSPFEEDVAGVIHSRGYLADHQVGSGGFSIDIGVRHPDTPGQYILAVECDGAAYHSALSARERDRHRQEVLEGMLWKFHRIWSTDWFRRRAGEIRRLEEALREARAKAGHLVVPGANDPGNALPGPGGEMADPTPPLEPGADSATTPSTPPALTAPAYRPADIRPDAADAGWEPHEIPPSHLARVVQQIIANEGPMHTDLIAFRVARAFDKTRAGKRIAAATRDALRQARREAPGELLEQDGFWFTHEQHRDVPVRDRKDTDCGVNRAEYLPPMEIRAGAEWIERESGRVDRAELIREVSRLLGFQQTGARLRQVIGKALDDR